MSASTERNDTWIDEERAEQQKRLDRLHQIAWADRPCVWTLTNAMGAECETHGITCPSMRANSQRKANAGL